MSCDFFSAAHSSVIWSLQADSLTNLNTSLEYYINIIII